MSYVYLLHFEKRISRQHTCQHYVGFAEDDLGRRLQEHRRGRGARLTQVARERGIAFEVVRVWKGGRDLERRIKRWKNAPRFCPVCGSGQLLDWTDELSPRQFEEAAL